MYGFKPKSARGKGPQQFAEGGLIRGPGTGTSDSIKTEKRPGTFIMPADSTQAITPEVLAKLGATEEMPEGAELGEDDQGEGGKVPVRLSNGEFDLPPEQVQALGEAVLTVMRNATHQPAGEQGEAPTGKGFTPHQFFSGGGTVKAEEQQRLANQTAMYVRGAQEAAANRPPAPPDAAAPVPAAPAPVAKDPLDGGAAFGVFPQLAGGKRTTYAMDDKLRTGVQATGPSTFAQATPTEKTIIGGGDGRRMNAEQDPRSLTATGMGAVAGVPGAAPSITPQTDVQRGGGNVPAVAPPSTNPAAPSPAATGAEIAPGVYRHGRGQYSDNAAGMAMPPGFTGQPNAQNMAAADALVARQTPAGFQPAGSQPAGVQAPVVRNSTNDWAARKALANAETAASSITNTRRWGGKGAESSPDVQAYQAMLRNDLALQQAQPGLDQAAMRENAGIQREGMQQDGATARTGIQEHGANAREAGRNALAQGEFGLKREAAGFQTRAAKRLEDLQNSYQSAKTPEERAAIAQQLRELQGKNAPAEWGVQVTPSIKNADGSTTEGSVYRFNKATGQTERVDGAGQPALPPGMKRQIGTSNGRPVYEDMNGKQVIAKG